VQVDEGKGILYLACDLQPQPAKVRSKVEIVMPRRRVASIFYREVCGENFRDLVSNLSSDRPIDIPALELYADLWERIFPQHARDLA